MTIGAPSIGLAQAPKAAVKKAPAKKAVRAEGRMFNVRTGETLLKYARWTGLKIEEVRRRLGFGPKERLRKGSILSFRLTDRQWDRFRNARRKFSKTQSPRPQIAQGRQGDPLRVHQVRKGETASSIAKSYGATVLLLRQLNGGRALDPVFPGEILRVPDRPAPTEAVLTTMRPALGSGALTIRVAAGETLSHLAQFAEIPADLILQVNDIPNPDILSRGSPIQIPIPQTQWNRFHKRRERFHAQKAKPETP